MSIGNTQPPVRREGRLEIAAPDGPEHGLSGQVAGQQACSPLEERQLRLVGLKPGAVQGQVGRAGGKLGPGLNQLLCNGLTNTRFITSMHNSKREYHSIEYKYLRHRDPWERSSGPSQ